MQNNNAMVQGAHPFLTTRGPHHSYDNAVSMPDQEEVKLAAALLEAVLVTLAGGWLSVPVQRDRHTLLAASSSALLRLHIRL